MSRSFKKNAGWTDHRSPFSKFAKKFANRKVRRTKNIPNGGAYKKIYESWEICEYKFLYFSKSEIVREIEKYGYYELYEYYMK